MKTNFKVFCLLWLMSLFIGCTSETKLKEQVQKVIKENPDILISAIEEKPTEFVEAFQKAVKVAQGALAKKREEEEVQAQVLEKQLEEVLKVKNQDQVFLSMSLRVDKCIFIDVYQKEVLKTILK